MKAWLLRTTDMGLGYTLNHVSARVRLALAAVVILATVAAQLPLAHWLGLEPPLEDSPALARRGARVMAQNCLHCHDLIPLPPRVRGWDVHRAYEALGRLPRLNRAMPGFRGTDEDRRALAAWLAAAGRGEAPKP
jgi:mono/diheme cytochrome c family protein